RDLVVVVDPAEVVELEMAGQGGRFACDPFHQVAIAALDEDAVVEELEPGLVVAGGEPLLGNRHPHAVAATLTKGTSRGLDPGGVFDLGMTRCLAAELPEVSQLL